MQTRFLYLTRYLVPVVDILLLNLVYVISFSLSGTELNRQYMVVGNLLWLFAALLFGMYRQYAHRSLRHFYLGTIGTVALHLLLVCAYFGLTGAGYFPKSFVICFYLILSLVFSSARFIRTYVQVLFIRRFYRKKKIAVMGNNRTGKRLAAYVRHQKHLAFYGFINYDAENRSDLSGQLSDLVVSEMRKAAAAGVVDVYVAISPGELAKIPSLMREADRQCLRLKFVPDFAGSLAGPYTISSMGGEFPVITLDED
ncbi:nucleoside-diphosphate sugar epimerase/dehydratase [Pedobacter sp. GR22-6]|uniref:nucleoside-diphosphate sugar epimerase/dehydratase n=1 Tax=Pedobacter sp. GR22-6 TaxID=3127957 RepID=UPI00307F2355